MWESNHRDGSADHSKVKPIPTKLTVYGNC